MKNLDYICDISGGLSCITNLEVAGSKEGKYGVAIIVSKDSQAAGVFTSNKVVAAPVKYTKNMIKNGIVSAIFVSASTVKNPWWEVIVTFGKDRRRWIVEVGRMLLDMSSYTYADSSS